MIKKKKVHHIFWHTSTYVLNSMMTSDSEGKKRTHKCQYHIPKDPNPSNIRILCQI